MAWARSQLVLLLLITVIVNFGMGIIMPILPILLKHYGFGTAGLSLPFLSLILGRFLSKYYANRLITYLNDNAVLLLCLALYLFIFILYPHLENKILFVAIRFLEGVVEGVCIIIFTERIIALSTDKNTGINMGLFNAAIGLGFIGGPLWGGIFFYYYDINTMFYSGAALGACAFLMAFFLIPGKTNKTDPNFAHQKGIVKKWRMYKPFLIIYSPSILRRGLFFSFMMVLPLYLAKQYQLNSLQIAYYFSISAIITTLLTPLSGKIADKLSSRKIAAYSLLIMAVLISSFGFIDQILFFTSVFFMETLAFTSMIPATMKIFAEMVKDHSMRREIIGGCSSVTEIVTLIEAVALPPLFDFSPILVWIFLGISCLLCALPFLRRQPCAL